MAIARRLAQFPSRIIGFLPSDAGTQDRTALLIGLATELASFVAGSIGVIGRWVDWVDHADAGPIAYPHGARIATITPPPCSDGAAATCALEEALALHASDLSRVLVDLSGYAPDGELPTAAEFVEGVVILVRRRRARVGRVAELARLVPAGKARAAILVG